MSDAKDNQDERYMRMAIEQARIAEENGEVMCLSIFPQAGLVPVCAGSAGLVG